MAGVRTPTIRSYEPLLLFFGTALVLFLGKALIVPLAFALTLCFLLLPTIRRLERRKIPRPAAVAMVGALTAVVLLLGMYVLSRQVLQLAQTLPRYRENMHRRIAALHSPAEISIEDAVSTLQEVGGELQPGHAPAAGEPVPVRLVSGGSRLEFAGELIGLSLRPIAQMGIVIVFAMYMLMRREDLRRRLLMLAGTARLGLMTRALDEAANRISRYLVLQFELNACYGLLFALGLWAIHVPDFVLWGVIAGALRIVPYAGTAVGMLLPLIASIAVSGSWWPPVLVVCWFVVLEAAVAYFVEPRILSTRTGISALALLVSAIFWTMLWGWPGLALATPLTVCVVVIGEYVPQLSFLHSLLGTDAQMSPAAHFYERLLSMDDAEAYAIAERFLEHRSLLDLYDAVVLRALHLAKEDRQRGTLDEAGWQFVLLSVGEVIARLPEFRQSSTATRMRLRELGIEASRSPGVKEIAVVCLSAGDEADDLAAQMLAQLMERAKFQTLTLTMESLSEEVLAGLSQEQDTVFVISALPPFAFAQARSMCLRLRRHMAENRVAIALWGTPEEHEDLASRFGACRPSAVVSTLAQSLALVSSWQEATRKP